MADKTDGRSSRELETREATMRPKKWVPPQSLPNPNPREGWVHRWVRVSTLGQADPSNTSAKFREGWEPCKAEEYPEVMHLADPTSRFKGNIENGGLLLCRIPVEIMRQRDEYYRNLSESQIKAVDNNYMRENDARMPLFAERKSTTSFGRGTKD